VQDLVALVQIGVDELQDTDSNLVSLVQEIVGRNSPRWKTTRFAAGNGTSKPFGIATRATIGGAIPAAQGVTAATSAVIVPDDLKKLQYVILSRFANVRLLRRLRPRDAVDRAAQGLDVELPVAAV